MEYCLLQNIFFATLIIQMFKKYFMKNPDLKPDLKGFDSDIPGRDSFWFDPEGDPRHHDDQTSWNIRVELWNAKNNRNIGMRQIG